MAQATRLEPEVEALRKRLEAHVGGVLSVRRSVVPAAQRLSQCDPDRRELFVASVAYISQQTLELAYNFTTFGIDALQRLDAHEWQEWVDHILDTYDSRGVLGCITAMQQVDHYVAELRRRHASNLALSEVAGVLQRFVLGLNGRPLQIASAGESYTDTETLFLPDSVSRFDSREMNFLLFKALATHQWAQCFFGTWRRDLNASLQAYAQPSRAMTLFHALETLRLDACIGRELPGMARQMACLTPRLGCPAQGVWERARRR